MVGRHRVRSRGAALAPPARSAGVRGWPDGGGKGDLDVRGSTDGRGRDDGLDEGDDARRRDCRRRRQPHTHARTARAGTCAAMRMAWLRRVMRRVRRRPWRRVVNRARVNCRRLGGKDREPTAKQQGSYPSEGRETAHRRQANYRKTRSTAKVRGNKKTQMKKKSGRFRRPLSSIAWRFYGLTRANIPPCSPRPKVPGVL